MRGQTLSILTLTCAVGACVVRPTPVSTGLPPATLPAPPATAEPELPPLTAGAKRILNLTDFTIAYEPEQHCALQIARNVAGEPGQWRALSRGEVVGAFYRVNHVRRGPGFIALRVLTTAGDRVWLRNEPESSGAVINR